MKATDYFGDFILIKPKGLIRSYSDAQLLAEITPKRRSKTTASALSKPTLNENSHAMHRVVTKYLHYQDGVHKLAVHRGPWHTDARIAQQWVDYLKKTGRYDCVEMESKNQESDSGQSHTKHF